MRRDLSKAPIPDHALYTEAVEALRVYHQAKADGIEDIELERLKMMAEHRFCAAWHSDGRLWWWHKRRRFKNRGSAPCRPPSRALVGEIAAKCCQMLPLDMAETREFEGLCIHTARLLDPTNNLRTSYPQGGYLALPN